MCAGVGSGGKFQKVPEGSGECWCRFRRQVPEGLGGFRSVLVWVPEVEVEFRKIPEVPVCAGVVVEGSREFRCV